MDKNRKWRRVLAIMLTVVMMLQNVQTVVWATDAANSTQGSETEIKKGESGEKTEKKEELGDEGEKDSGLIGSGDGTEESESSAALTSKASQSVTEEANDDETSYYANYRLDITNGGDAAAENMKVEVVLPTGSTVDTAKTYTTNYTEDKDKGSLTWDNQSIAASETGTYMFSVKIPAGVTELNNVKAVWYVNDSKVDDGEWVAGSDTTLAGNVKADTADNNSDNSDTSQTPDNNSGNSNTNNNGFGDNNNNDNTNEIPDSQASQVLTYNGNGVNAKLLLLSANSQFPEGFSFQVNPVSAEQNAAYVQAAQNTGLAVDTGVFYNVQLLYNGVNASLTSNESMQLQMSFDSAALTDVQNITDVGVIDGSVTQAGVSGNEEKLVRDVTGTSVGTVGVVGLSKATDGDEEPGDSNDTVPPTNGDETLVTKQVTYTGTIEGETTVNITMTGINLPEPQNVQVTMEKINKSSDDIYNALNASESNLNLTSDVNPLWMNEFYKVTLKDKTTETAIDLANAKVEFSLNEKGTLNINRGSASVYNVFCGTEDSISVANAIKGDNLHTDANGAYVENISFENVSNSNVFGVTAYRRSPMTIDLGQDNQIITSDTYFEWREKNSTGDGEWKKIENGSKVPADAQVRVYVSYVVNDILVKGDKLTFNLPPNFKTVTTKGTITKEDTESGDTVVIAEYEISGNTVTITCTDAFFDQDNLANEVAGNVRFSGQFTGISSGTGKEDVDFVIGGVDVKFDVEKIEEVKTNSLGIKKTVEDGLGQTSTDGNHKIEKFDDMLVYTVTVTAPSTNEKKISNVCITDEVEEGSNYIECLISDWNGKGHIETGSQLNDLTNGFDTGNNGFYYKRQRPDNSESQDGSNSTDSPDSWSISMNQGDKGLPSSFDISYMEPGETLTIKYAVKIKDTIIGLNEKNNNVKWDSHKITNGVKVTGDDNATSATAKSTIGYSKEWLNKTYEIVDNKHIRYTVKSNQQCVYNLKGWEFKDTLGKGEDQKYEEITVKWKDINNNEIGTSTWSSSTPNSEFKVNNEKTEFSWDAKDGYYKYEFTYTVELDNPEYIDQYSNNISLTSQENRENSFTTGTETGIGGYRQYNVKKIKTSIDINSQLNETTIGWQAEITSPLEPKNINVPASSAYTDTVVNDSETISQKMTEEQFNAITVKAYNSENKTIEVVSNSEAVTYYTTSKIMTGADITGFTLTFTDAMANSKYKTPVTITYKTTSDRRLQDIVSGNYKNTAVFKADENHQFNSGDIYQYTFSNLLNKEAVSDSYKYDTATKKKTVKWKFTVNNEKAQGMKNLEIRDTLPEGLKYLGLEDKSGLVRKDDDNLYNLVFKIKNCSGQKLEFYVITEITDAVDDNKGLRYYNEADLYIGGVKYGTASDTLDLNLKVLDKTATAEKNGTISYTLDINPARETFAPDDASTTLYIIDEMGENLELFAKSFIVKVDGADYDGCTVAPMEGDSTKFIIKGIPDGKHVVITYKAQAIDPAGSVIAYNKAILYCKGVEKADDDQKKDFSIVESDAGITKGTNIFIRKVDKSNYQALKGAHFEFGTATYSNGTFTYKKVKDKDLITDENGVLYFNSQTVGRKLETGTLYYFKETTPPDHYRGDGKEQIFCIIDKPVANKISGVTYLRSGSFINVFNESYDAGVSVTLIGKKMIENGTVSKDQFNFKIEAKNGAPLQSVDGNPVDSLVVTNDDRGLIQFGPINFKHTDLNGQTSETFEYELSEVKPKDAVDNKYQGVIYDAKTYKILITVTDDGKGNLSYTCTVNGKAYSAENSIIFQNKYDSMTTLRFVGTKELAGKSLTEHMFGFTITGNDGTNATVYNTKAELDGEANQIIFPMITIKNTAFTNPGTEQVFNYVIQEVDHGTYKNGIEYSSEIYNVAVTAKLNTDRSITIESVLVTDKDNKSTTIKSTDGVYSLTGDKPTFTNIYGATGTMTVSGTKILENESISKVSPYKFILEAKDGAPVRTQSGTKSSGKIEVSNDSNGRFQFDTLHYELADLGNKNEKTFTYEIKEDTDGTSDVEVNGVTTKAKGGVTYDTSVKTLKVTVKNKGNGELLVTAMLDGVPYAYTGNSSLLTFTNTFNASGKLELFGNKTLSGRTLQDKQFAFDVYDVSNSLQEKIEGDPIAQAVNDVNGNFRFEIPYTLKDIQDLAKLTRVYVVKEHEDGNHPGYTYDSIEYKVYVKLSETNGVINPEIKDIKVDGQSVKDTLDNNVLTFHNEYKATGKFTPEVSKRVYPDTRTQELEAGKFQFQIQGMKLDGTTEFPATTDELSKLKLDETTPIETVSNNKDKTGTVSFKDIEYVLNADHTDTLGKYVYKISEIENTELKGYTFAKPIYAFVTVSDSGTGELDVQVTYKSDDLENEFTNATFINYYSGDGEIQLVGKKSLTGRRLEANQFSFSLEVAKTDDAAGPKETDYKLIDTVKNDKDGIFTFPTLKFAHKTNADENVYDVGTYYYRIKEVLGTKDPAGYTYSQESYVIKVVVKDAESGSDKLQVEATLNGRPYSKEVAENPIIFTNKYNASGNITLRGTKTLSGSPLVKDQFTFELLDQDQKTVLQTVKNAADGSFAFQPLTYDQSLTAATGSAEKIYYVRETVAAAEKADGITYDSTLYKVTVTIKDKGDGTLETSSKIQTVSGTTLKEATAIKFANTFAGTATITKTAEDGKTPLPGAEFELYAAKANGSGYTLYGKYPSDTNGKVYVTGLPANSYYFVETKAPSGYLIPKDANGNTVKYSFTIGVNAGAGKVANAVADFSQTVVNGKGYGTVELTKYNAAETKTLAGAQFSLYDSNGKQVAVRRNEDGNYTYSLTASENIETTLVTGKDGKITINGLMWGSYYFQETTAPQGYILSTDKISFKVDDTSFDAKGNPVTIKTKATNIATSITIEKVDENGAALAGASMAIRDPQTRQIIETWTSTSEPHVIEGVLTAGKTYYLSEQQAPDGYEIAAEQEFTVPADGKTTVTMTDKKSNGKEGKITVTKKISLVDEDANVVEAFAKDYTAYIGIFTDPAGEHPYGGDYLQTVQIHNGSSGTVTFTGLPKGTYYIFETDVNGTPLAYDDFQTGDIGSFICTVEDGDATVTVKNKSDNSVTLNNVYYDFPDGFAYSGTINITKNVVKDGETTDVDDTFYAGIFTKDDDGTYVLLNGMVYELLQNDTISVNVPLGGESGADPITYYVMETDETGTPIDKDVFAYEVSGEGTVSLDKDNLEGAITIVNTVDEEVDVTPTPTPSSPSDTTTTTSGGTTTAQVHEGDSKRVIGVKTGDNTPIGAYAAVLVIAALAIAGGIVYKKKKKKGDR